MDESFGKLCANGNAAFRCTVCVDTQNGGNRAVVELAQALADLAGDVAHECLPVALPPLVERLRDDGIPEHPGFAAQACVLELGRFHDVHGFSDAVLNNARQPVGKVRADLLELVAYGRQPFLVLVQHIRQRPQTDLCAVLKALAPFAEDVDLERVLDVGLDAFDGLGGRLLHHAGVVALHPGQQHLHGCVAADLAAFQDFCHLLQASVIRAVSKALCDVRFGADAGLCQLVQLFCGQLTFRLDLRQSQDNSF